MPGKDDRRVVYIRGVGFRYVSGNNCASGPKAMQLASEPNFAKFVEPDFLPTTPTGMTGASMSNCLERLLRQQKRLLAVRAKLNARLTLAQRALNGQLNSDPDTDYRWASAGNVFFAIVGMAVTAPVIGPASPLVGAGLYASEQQKTDRAYEVAIQGGGFSIDDVRELQRELRAVDDKLDDLNDTIGDQQRAVDELQAAADFAGISTADMQALMEAELWP